MSDENGARPAEHGFELAGEFYRWALSDQGKDLMLIDRFTAMPVPDFFQLVDDGIDLELGRGSVVLAMIATSVRAKHPDWSVERIMRLVQETSLSDVEFIGGEVEADSELPPTEAAPPDGAAAETSSSSPSDDSSSSSTPTASSSSKTSSGSRA